ncbi:MAG TPA: RHS repeat-associated core domain-containing protein, partial [Steroidobacteraceae bacterium]
GARSEKFVAGGTTTWHDYVAAGGGLVAERSCTGATPCSSGATWSFFVSDHLGSIAVITNAAGTATEQLSYDAWGRRRNLNGTDNSACSITSATSRGYTGHEMLDSICEINANARIYDPTIGRFMTPDSVVSDGSDSQSLNRYSYVGNNPLWATDPSGHVPRKDQAGKSPAPRFWVNHDGLPCWGCFGPGVFGVDPDGTVVYASEMAYRSVTLSNGYVVTARARDLPMAVLNLIIGYGIATGQIADASSTSTDDPEELPSGGLQNAGLIMGEHDYTAGPNQICPASWHCTAAMVGRAYTVVRNAVPGASSSETIVSGGTYTVWLGYLPGGQVTVVVGNGGLTVSNMTNLDHVMLDGWINRNAFQVDGAWYSYTHGTGTNYFGGAFMAMFNQFIGPILFNGLDDQVRNDLYKATH